MARLEGKQHLEICPLKMAESFQMDIRILSPELLMRKQVRLVEKEVQVAQLGLPELRLMEFQEVQGTLD